MEIERKYLISHIPFDIAGYPFHQIEQAYLSTAPVVRVRQEDDTYYLTYKSKGLMAREEYNLPLTKESYEHLRSKADGRILTKKRYLIPMEGTEYTIELDIFLGEYEGLKLAEVALDRKVLADIAVNDPAGFTSLVETAKAKLA